MNVPHERVRAQIEAILQSWGMAPELLQTTVEAMIETDLLGVDSHGISMLMTYEKRVRDGSLKLTVAPRVEKQTACTALVDGGAGLGHPVSAFAMNLAVDKAKEAGVGIVGVHNSHHFGAAGVYARIAARRGAIGMVTSATRGVTMVPTRGAAPVLGTNPLAFAAPAKRNNAFVLDMATTTTAAGKVKVYDLNDRQLPSGWVLDAKGQPVTDPKQGFDIVFNKPEGGLSPLGGTAEMASAKGYGLAMMVHILGGTLVGSSFSPIRNRSQKPGDPDDIGHFFMAIDPAAFRSPGEFENDLDDVIDVMHATPATDPSKPVLVAGEPEEAERQRRLRDGIPVPDSLDKLIRGICERSNAPYLLA
ncbi:Ldh family oxidoreductase [Neoroseomonas terrae]|uniref:Ldh family oxidoreductase n=1 Tax=Neoroseomonas terrae TaxID=424799 RepID=UPI001BA68914